MLTVIIIHCKKKYLLFLWFTQTTKIFLQQNFPDLLYMLLWGRRRVTVKSWLLPEVQPPGVWQPDNYQSLWLSGRFCSAVRTLASFPGPARSSLAVRNSRRGPGLVHHVMSAAAYVTAISLRINDVIGWSSTAFYVERGSQRSQWWFVHKLS